MKNKLSQKDLKQIKGGSGAPWSIIGYIAQEAFGHSDQIIKGFKKGWKKY